MTKTFFGVAHPWLCDSMGHLNTRNYIAMFDDASMHYLAAIGWSPVMAQTDHRGWADVRGEIDYHVEVPMGHLIEIETVTKKLGSKSLTIFSEMRNVSTSELHSTMLSVIVHFDLRARRAIEIPDAFRKLAENLARQNESDHHVRG